MKIETYIIAWNRESTIHLTINHYAQLGKVFLYDNFSTDSTREIAESLGADVRLFGREGVLDDGVYLDIKNHCWKKSDADWVIIVDDDEILYHPYLKIELQLAKDSGATLIHPQGFAIYSNEMPVKEWVEIMDGIKDDQYSKLCCFDPKAITDINYVYGCHEARPKGRVREVFKLFLLHYHCVGGAERMINRHALYAPRRLKSPVNVRWKLGEEYGFTPDSKRRWFRDRLEKSVPFIKAGLL